MKLLTVIALLMLSSCSMFEEPEAYHIDPRLKSFEEEFYIEAKSYGLNYRQNFSIEMIQGMGQDIGLCYHEKKLIKINEQYLMKHLELRTHADTVLVRFAVWHELGHSIGKPHRGGLSIMAAGDGHNNDGRSGDFIQTIQTYNRDSTIHQQVIDELFLN